MTTADPKNWEEEFVILSKLSLCIEMFAWYRIILAFSFFSIV